MNTDNLNNKQANLLTTPLIIWLSITIIGFTVKLLHLLSSVFIVIGFAGLTAYLIHNIITFKNKNWLNLVLIGLGLLFVFVLFTGAFFNDGYPINEMGVLIYSIVFNISFVYYYFKNRKKTV